MTGSLQNPAEGPPPLALPESVDSSAQPRLWGFWMTLLLSLAIMGVYVVLQLVVGIVLFVFRFAVDSTIDPMAYAQQLEDDGLYLALATLLAAPAGLAFIALFTGPARGIPCGDYIRLTRPSARALLSWTALAVAFMVSSDALRLALGMPLVPDEVVAWYQSAVSPPLLWFALVIAAPAFEESFFRGFMLRGFAASSIGPWGAVVLTALFWALLHIQYDLFGVATIFVFGLMLGAAQLRTGSLYVPLAMHALNNAVSTFETAWVASHSP
ncbi:MAG: CPBP family intramembrane metalloprotease [Candidatus Hydrogenedentes bacterium]|nr:CPBP family intramembrane metalloprotease [Candidatus Hydrogenedentota bacterium]